MPLKFQDQFVDKILSGIKTTTVRQSQPLDFKNDPTIAPHHKRVCRAGQLVNCYTGSRFKPITYKKFATIKIIKVYPNLTPFVEKICGENRIIFCGYEIRGGASIAHISCTTEGFSTSAEMIAFFEKMHGDYLKKTFVGYEFELVRDE